MKIYLVGISCIGKTTIGCALAKEIGYHFFDLDHEIESYFNKSIAKIQSKFITGYSYRDYVSVVLKNIIAENKNSNHIVALPPSGLRDCFLRELKKDEERIVIALHDRPRNILNRITFFDDDSNIIERKLKEKEKKAYLRELRLDNTYFNRIYKRADYHVDIDGLSIVQCVDKLKIVIEGINNNIRNPDTNFSEK
jgi:shikimate kinase